MEVLATRRQRNSFSSVVALHLYQWALRELIAKGYSARASDKAISKALYQLQGRKIEFVKWVNDKPSYESLEQKALLREKAFVKCQLTRTVYRILTRKGYSHSAAKDLTKRLIQHSGGPEHCDINAVLAAARHWPSSQYAA
ncbi:hypothetical protein EOPP23_10290 [Endozoicomonas sp. OPT23]|uniref:hypothetical protein n=1 Tax=Endozoicomonas sp. OPT23 TaxID=2072845 RepID=UPI00129B27C8|nr:hypothetical protein [Endozoicomonas sp. OPT23]MRI33373.1 hypothetical protein [Endozoicomonas sp. OPT23]